MGMYDKKSSKLTDSNFRMSSQSKIFLGNSGTSKPAVRKAIVAAEHSRTINGYVVMNYDIDKNGSKSKRKAKTND